MIIFGWQTLWDIDTFTGANIELITGLTVMIDRSFEMWVTILIEFKSLAYHKQEG